jgi:hypothetical protein
MWPLLKRWDFWFGLLGAIGLAFAVFAYVATNRVGRISYIFDTQKVFDPANLSGFSLVNPDKNPVEQPVYATEVVVWNSGDLSLSDNSDRVREPLKISLNGVIYYHLIGKINLVDVGNYRIDSSIDKSSVTINWKFFDPGQGIRLTLLHSDNGDPKVALSGRFYEASLQQEVRYAKNVPPVWFFFVGLAVVFLGMGIFYFFRRNTHRPAGQHTFRQGVLSGDRLRTILMFCSVILGSEGFAIIVIFIYFSYFLRSPPV